MDWIKRLRTRRLLRSSPYRTVLACLPAGLETSWRHSAPQEYPGIPTDAFFLVLHGFPGNAALIFRKKKALSR